MGPDGSKFKSLSPGAAGGLDPSDGREIFIEGSPYDDLTSETLQKTYACENVTMQPGDRLYMPYGVLHRAVTGEGGSTHVTFEFTKRGVTWFELILGAAGQYRPRTQSAPALLLEDTA